MNAILITLNIIVLSALAALAIEWPPALFAFLLVGPISILSIWGISKGGLSARMIFVSTGAISLAGIVAGSYFSPAAYYGLLVVAPVVLPGGRQGWQDLTVMLGITCVLMLMAYSHEKITRREGALLLAMYLGYMCWGVVREVLGL